MYQCSLDGAPMQVYSSPKLYTGLTYDIHTFEVQAIKPHLLVDPTPTLHEWTVEDRTAPETRIVSGPAAETGSTSATKLVPLPVVSGEGAVSV